MSRIYHYCSAETLKLILELKTLRLTDIRKSSDSKEIDFLYDSYIEWKKQTSSDVKNLDKEERKLIKKKEEIFNTTNFLVICFSKDDDELHMWKSYGNSGVCIGFNKEKLNDYIKLVKPVYKKNKTDIKENNILSMKEIQYLNQKQIDSFFKKNFVDEDRINELLIHHSTEIKSDYFKRENEVRIVYIFNQFSPLATNSLTVESNESPYENAIRKDTLIKLQTISSKHYQHKMVLDIPFPTSLIESITIGHNSSLTPKDIKELLFINEIPEKGIEIKKSCGTYR